jgi:hypothetical protein
MLTTTLQNESPGLCVRPFSQIVRDGNNESSYEVDPDNETFAMATGPGLLSDMEAWRSRTGNQKGLDC